MSHKLLLVDYENVQQVDLSRLGENFHVVIFVGSNQKSVPIELVTSAQKLGSRVEWQRVEGNLNSLNQPFHDVPLRST